MMPKVAVAIALIDQLPWLPLSSGKFRLCYCVVVVLSKKMDG